jgi:hypothetical protein
MQARPPGGTVVITTMNIATCIVKCQDIKNIFGVKGQNVSGHLSLCHLQNPLAFRS